MPSRDCHLAVASRNAALIAHLLPDIERFPEWIATVAFYRAVHLVEAVFFLDAHIKHSHNHEARDRHLKTNRKYSNIYRHYRPL